MNIQRIVGIVICLCGLVMIGAAFYINGQVEQGRQEIAAGQQKINQVKGIFSLTSQTKPLGDTLTSSGQQRIAMGQQQADEYAALANKLQIGGIVLAIVGLGIALFWRTRRN